MYLKITAQLSGILNVPANYTSVASVISAINQQSVSGALTVNIASGFTETVVQGGYTLTTSGSATSPIIFQKSGIGANPLLIAYSGGSGTPGSMRQDGIWRLIGCDYITIDGIDIVDQNITNPATMEFGIGLFKVNGADGCQNNTIKNCVITLNRINNASGSGAASDGSRGIDVVNALTSVHNAVVTVSNSAGCNSNNYFYSNTIQNCNIGISLIGFTDVAPFMLSDHGNDVGGNLMSNGNSILNFGGGGASNSSAAIRTLAQYDLNISNNTINNNTGQGINHPTLLRGIHLNAALGANSTINSNTLTLNGGATSSQLSVIENASGSAGISNTVSITNNLITNCTYTSALSGAFYGIWNSASPNNLTMSNNSFVNNSTSASSGSTYLIYNNGSVNSLITINNNALSFMYNGSNAYGGTLYSIYNSNGTLTSSLTINNNVFSNFYHLGGTGTGNIYFISNTNDSYQTSINNNTWHNMVLNHSGSEFLINNNSATQFLLNVNDNAISGIFLRNAAAGATYLYYGTGNSPATCAQSFTNNNFSNITATVSGTGAFYGIYTTDGTGSPYPKKSCYNNLISNVSINSTGNFYGYYFDNLGDANSNSPSAIYGNTLSNVYREGSLYGIYIASAVSPSFAPLVYSNVIHNLNSSGTSSTLYGSYLTGGGQGLNFYKNKISKIIENGSSGIAHGVYVSSAINTTLSNNFIGHISTPNSSVTNATNGLYINGGNLTHVFYNTIYLDALSTGGNFNSNALYASSTCSIHLKNNILMNISSGGTGITTAYRRSSSALTNHLSTSNNNLFYAGIPSTTNLIFQGGATSYSTLVSFQSALNPRESLSATQNVNFLSLLELSPTYLHIVPYLNSPIESGASAIGSINDDFDGQIRQGNIGYMGNGTAPDIGADEYDQNTNPCNSANAGIISPASSTLCAGQSVSLMSQGYSQGTGVSHQWKLSTNANGPYSMVSAGVGVATPELYTSALSSGTFYFVLETTCLNSSQSVNSSAATVVVNAIPSVTATTTNTLVCAGQSITLTGTSNMSPSFQWYGSNGFNSTLQNPIIQTSSSNPTGVYYVSATQNNCTSPQSSLAISISDVSLTIAATASALCLGNTTALSLTTSGLTYTWNTGATTSSVLVSPTTNTVYNVAVTNSANCTVSKSIAISVINPSITASNTLICGNSASVILSVNAFTPSIVNWYTSPTSTNVLANGIGYSLSVSTSTTLYVEATNTLGGCQSQRIPVTLTLSPNPSLTISANPATVCPGSFCILNAMGATTYSWSGLGSGTTRTVFPNNNQVYTVTGKDAFNCSATGSISIKTHTAAMVSIVQTATSVCPSSVVTFTASGANSYIWNTGANGSITTVTPATNSTYTVYGSNTQSCVTSKTMAVTTKSVPVISIIQSTNSICPGEAITFTATGAITYTWLPGSVVSNSFSANPFVSSIYNALGRSINTCTNVGIANVVVIPCTSMIELDNEEMFISPNPCTGIFKINFDDEIFKSISISTTLGKVILKRSSSEFFENFDLSFHPKGIYFIQVEVKNKVTIKKLILE
jgi:hypothetical protein